MAQKQAAAQNAQTQLISANTALIVIVAATLVTYITTFSNSYVFWDDPEYILHNPLMTAPLSEVFNLHTYYLANYHPLTILVYTWEHKMFGDHMGGYHAVSLLLHLTNSLLVFFFIYHLLKKKNVLLPFITAMLFAIHPMHVESVAWASELKDVLYTFFFLASLVCYVRYIQQDRQLKYLAAAMVTFLLSLISKGQAVTLPLCFILIDYYHGRKLNVSMVTDKLLFFAASLFFGLEAVKAQNSEVLTNHAEIVQTFFWGFYGLGLYLYKFILPVNLSGLYPYPYTESHSTPMFVFIIAIAVMAMLVFIIWKFRSNKFIMFGLLFFLANIFTLLKFMPVGDAIMADRYSYIPYIGLFFIVAYLFNKLLFKPEFKEQRKLIQYGGIGLLIVLSGLSFERVTIWKDTFSFWGDAIKKDKTYWRPYYCMGQEYYDKGDYRSALNSFTGGIIHDKFCPPLVYMWRGVTYLEQFHQTDSAIADFKKVLDFGNKADPSQIQGRLNLGLAYYRKGDFDNALKVYTELISMDPNEKTAYFQRGLVHQYSGHPEPQLALADYNHALQLDPTYSAAYLNRGSLYVDQLHQYDLAIADFNKTLEFDPTNTDAVMNKGIANYREGNFDEALRIYNSMQGNMNDKGKIFYLKALCYAGKKDFKNALLNGQEAQKSGLTLDPKQLEQWSKK